jgi:hypothetical protein
LWGGGVFAVSVTQAVCQAEQRPADGPTPFPILFPQDRSPRPQSTCHACHACSDAQLPSPSPPMQSKTVDRYSGGLQIDRHLKFGRLALRVSLQYLMYGRSASRRCCSPSTTMSAPLALEDLHRGFVRGAAAFPMGSRISNANRGGRQIRAIQLALCFGARLAPTTQPSGARSHRRPTMPR